MKKLLLILFGLVFCFEGVFAATRHVVQNYPAPNYNYFTADSSNPNYQNINNNKLAQVERSIFGRTFETQNANIRLNRLEKSVFNRTYPNMPFDERLNNLIVNYNNSYQDTYSTTQTTKQKRLNGLTNTLGSMFFGMPTGMSPQVNPYWNSSFNAPNGRQTDYYGNRGWYHHNDQIGNGCGIHILD